MEKKLIVNMEFSRDDVATVATLANVELGKHWDKLTEKPVNISLNDIDDKEAKLAMLFVVVGIAIQKAYSNGS